MKTIISVGIILLGLIFLMVASTQAIVMDDIGITNISEEFGKWRATFDWSEMDEYRSSISHENIESGKEKAITDSLTISASEDRSKVLKLSVITYSSARTAPLNSSRLKSLANETLEKSDVCGEVDIIERMINGQKGIYTSGLKNAR